MQTTRRRPRELSITDVDGMKGSELRSELRVRTLSAKGLKAELAARLRDALLQPLQPAAAAGVAPLDMPPPAARAAVLRRTMSSSASPVQAHLAEASDPASVWHAVDRGDLPRLQAMIAGSRGDPALARARSPDGALPLHKCCLKGHRDCVEWFLRFDASLGEAQYTGGFAPDGSAREGPGHYDGENCLHIAIVKQDHELAVSLARRFPALLAQCTQGTLFAKGGHVQGAYMNIDSPCYYGGFPLHFAASTIQPALFDALLALEPSALWRRDPDGGNAVLHMCVLHESPVMYDHVCEVWDAARGGGGGVGQAAAGAWEQPSQATVNGDGMDPLTLAAELGSRLMFEHILERAKKVLWRYGPITCLMYPLRHLDPPRGGALRSIIAQEHLHMLEIPILKDLIKKKWETFGRRTFYTNLRNRLATMVVFCLCTLYRQSPAHYASTLREHATNSTAGYGARMQALSTAASDCVGSALSTEDGHTLALGTCLLAVGDVLVLLVSCQHLARKLWERRGSMRGRDHLAVPGTNAFAPHAVLKNVFSLGVVLAFVMRCGVNGASPASEAAVLTVVSVIGWMQMIYFLTGDPATGPIVIILQKMFVKDIVKLYVPVYVIFLVGFAQAFVIEFEGYGLSALLDRMQSCFLTMVGDLDFASYTDASKVQHPLLTTFLITFYIIVISVMLLNLLIAMMGDTYSTLIADAGKIWELEHARILFSFTKGMTDEEKHELQEYQVEDRGASKDDKYSLQVFHVNPHHFKGEQQCSCAPCKARYSSEH